MGPEYRNGAKDALEISQSSWNRAKDALEVRKTYLIAAMWAPKTTLKVCLDLAVPGTQCFDSYSESAPNEPSTNL